MAHGVVDLEVYSPTGKKDELRRELGLPSDRTILLYAGNIILQKGVYELIDAFDRLRAGNTAVALVLCGSGTEAHRLRILVEQRSLEGLVLQAGQVAPTEMHKWMQASDVFVLPSYHEGMPNAVMEAMACGLPVISTGVGGLPDAVGDSDGAILIEPRTVDPLVEAMHNVCANPALRRRMSLAARETAVARFGIDNNARTTLDYLRAVRLPPRTLSRCSWTHKDGIV